MYQILIEKTGPADVLRRTKLHLPDPSSGQVIVKNSAIAVNFKDIHRRSGRIKAELPLCLGSDGAGEILSVGNRVTGFKVGDRVAYGLIARNAYASHTAMDASFLHKIPDEIDFDLAASLMMKGMTAYYLANETYAFGKNEMALIYAAAGGVGSLLCQLAHENGATIIAVAGSEKKCALALENGARYAINRKTEDVLQRVLDISGNRGVDVVYDSIGQPTLDTSLACLKPRGLLVSFGNTAGKVENFGFAALAKYGSLFVTRPTIKTYMDTAEKRREAISHLFGLVLSGKLRIPQFNNYSLEDAQQAHKDLEAGLTAGSVILNVQRA